MMADAAIGRVFGRYRVTGRLGAGAMGEVFAAVDGVTGERVALKVLYPQLLNEPGFRERFEQEAHVATLLRSPYTVPLHGYGVADGTAYLAMEYVDGPSVAALLEQRGRLDARQALTIGLCVARALEEAAVRGIVHRDVKPANILLAAEGHARLADFGIARRSQSVGQTLTGMYLGTVAYGAPEQQDGLVDHRSDIYALGATLYHLLAGRPPYVGSLFDVLQQHRSALFPAEGLADQPDEVVFLIRRCMPKNPADRFQSATDLANAIERTLAALSASGQGRLAVAGDTVAPPPAVPGEPSLSETERVAPTPLPPPPFASPVAGGAPPTRAADTPEAAAPAPTRIPAPPVLPLPPTTTVPPPALPPTRAAAAGGPAATPSPPVPAPPPPAPAARARRPLVKDWRFWAAITAGILVLLFIIGLLAGDGDDEEPFLSGGSTAVPATRAAGSRATSSGPNAPATSARQFARPQQVIDAERKRYSATIKTTKGDILVSLFADIAPNTVNNFVFLSQQGFYNGLKFHRIEPNFIAQTGDPTGTSTGNAGYQVAEEPNERANRAWTVSMAKTVGGTTFGSQFFINLKDNPALDKASAAPDPFYPFGLVTIGNDVALQLSTADTIVSVTIHSFDTGTDAGYLHVFCAAGREQQYEFGKAGNATPAYRLPLLAFAAAMEKAGPPADLRDFNAASVVKVRGWAARAANNDNTIFREFAATAWPPFPAAVKPRLQQAAANVPECLRYTLP